MQKRRTTKEWMAASLLVALAIAFVAHWHDPSAEKLSAALRATARWSFMLFWLAYVGGALVTLFGARFEPLARRARDFGLSFASAHLVHLALVARLIHVEGGYPLSPFILFAIAVFWIYLLAFLSIGPIATILGRRTTRILRTIGVEYIAFAFLLDFAKNPFHQGLFYLASYLPFLTLAIVGPLLRLAAAVKRINGSRRSAALWVKAGAGVRIEMPKTQPSPSK
jgi:hypothetical protein